MYDNDGLHSIEWSTHITNTDKQQCRGEWYVLGTTYGMRHAPPHRTHIVQWTLAAPIVPTPLHVIVMG